MTSSSNCFFLVSLIVSLLFFLGSNLTMASTKDIDFICNSTYIHNKMFCLQTLTAYPPAVSATNMVKLVKVAVDLVMTQAKQTADYVAGLENDPTFKKHFKLCNASYDAIVLNLRSARLELEHDDPETASYDIFVIFDQTKIVKDEVGKKTDKDSKRLMEMTLVMEDFLDIANGAVDTIQHAIIENFMYSNP